MTSFFANDSQLPESIDVAIGDNHVLNVLNYIDYIRLNDSLNSEHKCLTLHRNQSKSQQQECEVNWDKILCWPRTPADTLATIPCFNEFNGIRYDNTREYHASLSHITKMAKTLIFFSGI